VVLLGGTGPRLSSSQVAGEMTGGLKPAKTMAVRRAGRGLASRSGVPESPGCSDETQYAGDTNRV